MKAQIRFTLLAALAALTARLTASAATPSSGTLTDTSGPVVYSAGPFTGANATPIPEVDSGPECNNPTLPCDEYALTVALPAGYAALHPNAVVKVTMSWTDTGTGQSDYDLYIYKGAVSTTDGSQPSDYGSASSLNPEIGYVNPVNDGSSLYTLMILPAKPTGETLSVRIELLPGTGGRGAFGGPDPTTPGAPRYQNFFAPSGSTAESSQGEFNIGFNPHTGRILTMNTGPIWRLTPPELLTPKLPACCEALWEDKSALTTNTGLDPILWTDQKSGRTLASNSTAGANAVYAYSDNDGDTWTEIGAGPPDGGADHQTIGTGPFPASLSLLTTPLNKGENTLYCSQDIVGPAMCQRSLDLGMTWGPGVPAYTGSGPDGCGGLHGHVHIAPNGTAWLPVSQCRGVQGGVTSTDAGTTWKEFVLPTSRSQVQGADPSIALDSDSTAYYCYVNNETVPAGSAPEGHVHVQVSHDGGATWGNDTDLGASHGIKNAAETEAVGGSSGRAACGFLGTNVNGDYQADGFPGVWYAFIATTYDGGKTWTTVNATPNDPVQSGTGIWQQGGAHPDRNLLDFNEITVDDHGRVLYGYSDGCVTTSCIAGTSANDGVAFMRVARQSGGRGLFASLDAAEPAAPKPPCLSGTRDPSAAHLTWKAPDNGGADIVNYQIFRGTSTGGETLLAQTGNVKTTFTDTTVNPSVGHYFYVVKAVNSVGVGISSNELDLVVVIPPPAENVCALPGLTELTDPSGDTDATIVTTISTPAPPGSDLLSFQLSQPYSTDGIVRLAFTLNTDPGESPQPPASAWYVAMKIPDPAPATTFHYRAVHMAWSGIAPTFESYTPKAGNSGVVDGRFATPGSQLPAEADSSYVTPFNRVVIVVKASDLGLNPGDTIAGFVAGVSQSSDAANIGTGITGLYDQMPDSLGFTGSYTVRSNQLCSPEGPPIAVLQVLPNVGCAPLSVALDGSQSYDPDGDPITAWTFQFGDGSAPVTQNSPTTTHTYPAGNFLASLKVACARGASSTKLAQSPVEIASPPAAPAISAPASAHPNQSGLTASVASHAGSQYSWSISNGTLTAGQGSSQITFTAGTKGSVSLSVQEISSAGCVSPAGNATVTIGKK